MNFRQMNTGTLALTLLAVAEVPNFYSGLLPSLWTIGHFSATESAEARYWIRRGEVTASALTAAVALATSYIAKSWAPAIGMGAMALALLYLYEHALSNGKGAAWEQRGESGIGTSAIRQTA